MSTQDSVKAMIRLSPTRQINSTDFDAPEQILCQKQIVQDLFSIAQEQQRNYPALIEGFVINTNALCIADDTNWMGWEPVRALITTSELSLEIADINGNTIHYAVDVAHTEEEGDAC